MIPIKYDEKNEASIKKYLEIVKQGRSPRHIKEINSLCELYLGCGFDDVIVASPDELISLKEKLDKNPNKALIVGKFKKICSSRVNKYISKVMYEKLSQEGRKILFELANSDVCPYCNRNFIELINIDGKGKYTGTFQLDHFFDKDSYPMFAVSAYNLIPVCSSCNRIKLNKEFEFYPYSDLVTVDDMKFDFAIKDWDFMNNCKSIDILINNISSQLKSNVQGLYLENVYQKHVDVVQELIMKVYYYGDGYIESIMVQTNDLFSSKEEIYRLLFGNYMEKKDYSKRPLAKFTGDILEVISQYYQTELNDYLVKIRERNKD